MFMIMTFSCRKLYSCSASAALNNVSRTIAANVRESCWLHRLINVVGAHISSCLVKLIGICTANRAHCTWPNGPRKGLEMQRMSHQSYCACVKRFNIRRESDSIVLAQRGHSDERNKQDTQQ